MLKDRGTIKWTSLMLPEHVELLKEMWQETEKINKPILDLQELELMNEQVMQAYEERLPIVLSVYKDGLIEEIHGTIVMINVQQNQLNVQLKNGLEKIIDGDQIVSLQII